MKEDTLKKKTLIKKVKKKSKKRVKKESKLKQVYIFVKKKIASIVTMVILLIPTILEVLNIHKDIIKEEYGVSYYLAIAIAYACYNFYNTTNKIKESRKNEDSEEESEDSESGEDKDNEDKDNEEELPKSKEKVSA